MEIRTGARRSTAVALAAASGLTLLLGAVGCGDSENEAVTDARQDRRIDRIQEKLDQQNSQPDKTVTETTTVPTTTTPPATTTAPPSSTGVSGSRSCGSGVSAGGSASCPFAVNVRDAYYQSGQSSSFEAYSPVTGQTYTVSCSGSGPATCTAGNNAVIYIG